MMNEQAIATSILRDTEDAVIGKDLDAKILYWNKGAERLYGYTAKEVVGRTISVILPSGHLDELAEIMKRVKAGDTISHYETQRRHKDGHLINISLTVSPIRDPKGVVVGASSIGRDMTEEVRARELLARSGAVATLAAQAATLDATVKDFDRRTEERVEALRQEEARKRRWTAALLGLAIIIVAGLGVLVLTRLFKSNDQSTKVLSDIENATGPGAQERSRVAVGAIVRQMDCIDRQNVADGLTLALGRVVTMPATVQCPAVTGGQPLPPEITPATAKPPKAPATEPATNNAFVRPAPTTATTAVLLHSTQPTTTTTSPSMAEQPPPAATTTTTTRPSPPPPSTTSTTCVVKALGVCV